MKNDIVSKIDRYIDNDLYAFPYIDDVKEALEDKEREQIASYAQNLKKALKFINANISRQEREKLDFNPRHIKKMFDTMMFDYYYKPFYDALTKLLIKHGGYARELIDEFMFRKSNDYGTNHYWAGVYKQDLREMLNIAMRNANMKKKPSNNMR